MATWAVQFLCDVFLYGLDNDMSISATFRPLKAQISAFRIAAGMDAITQCIGTDLMCMVLVWSSMHTLWDAFQDLGSDCRHRLQSKRISSLSLTSTPALLNMQKQILAYLQNVHFVTFFLLTKILTTNFNEGNTSILNLLFSVSSNNSIIQSGTILGCKGPLKII